MAIDMFEVSQRGDANFDSLTEMEQCLYLVFDFQIIQEMEGFTHYLTTSRNTRLRLLHEFLRTIGDVESADILGRMMALVERNVRSWNPDDVDAYFCDVRDEIHRQVYEWGDRYYALTSRRWELVNAHLVPIGFGPVV